MASQVSINTTRFDRSIGAAACVVVGAFVLSVAWHKVDSIDTGYHLAYGGRFLETGRIVDRDPFIYPEHAEPFVNANWGSQVIMAGAYRLAGARGLVALRLGLTAILFVCIALVVRNYSRDLHWVAAAWLLAAAAGYERLGLRPELFSYAIMSAMLVLLVRGVRSKWAVAGLVLLQLVWVNLHSYFLIGLMLQGAFLVDAFISGVRNRADASDRSAARRLAIGLGLSVLACLVNPWTWRGAVFPLETLSYLNRENIMGGGPEGAAGNAWSLISEFHSPFRYTGEMISGRTIDAYWVLILVAGAGVLTWLANGRIGAAAAIVLLGVMSVQMRRNIAQFAFVGGALAIGGLASFVKSTGGFAGLRRAMATLLATGLIGAGGWWTVGVVDGRFYYSERRTTRQFGAGFCERTFPAAAARWLADHSDLQPNLFVDYFSSSNTLPWLPGRYKLFVDTNTFACPEPILRTAFDVGLGRVDHTEVFDSNKINIVLLHGGPDTQALVKRLVADYTNWALVYFDREAMIFVRRIPAHVEVIKANPRVAADLRADEWIALYEEPAATKALSLGTAVSVPLSLGWYEPAAKLMDEAVRIAPDYHEAWYRRGVCRVNLGNAAAKAKNMAEARRQYAEALESARRALSIEPRYQPAVALANDMEQILRAVAER